MTTQTTSTTERANVLTRKHTRNGLSIWRTSERPARSGCHYESRPHWVVAPSWWDDARILRYGAILLHEHDALMFLGELIGLQMITRGYAGLPETPEQRVVRIVRWAHGVFDLGSIEQPRPAAAGGVK